MGTTRSNLSTGREQVTQVQDRATASQLVNIGPVLLGSSLQDFSSTIEIAISLRGLS